jgi:hypothetical protein
MADADWLPQCDDCRSADELEQLLLVWADEAWDTDPATEAGLRWLAELVSDGLVTMCGWDGDADFYHYVTDIHENVLPDAIEAHLPAWDEPGNSRILPDMWLTMSAFVRDFLAAWRLAWAEDRSNLLCEVA